MDKTLQRTAKKKRRETYRLPHPKTDRTHCMLYVIDTHFLWQVEGFSLLSLSSSAWFCQSWRFLSGLACQTCLLSTEITDVTSSLKALTLLCLLRFTKACVFTHNCTSQRIPKTFKMFLVKHEISLNAYIKKHQLHFRIAVFSG